MSSPPEVVSRYSSRRMAFFGNWLEGYFARNFDAVRTASPGAPDDRGGPLLVYSNHPSWWDPIHFLLLARFTFPKRRMFGPFDAEALKKYSFFGRIGGFGIDTSSRRGAADFLRTSLAILEVPDATLWITAQGEFADPRSRPLSLQPGLAHLARRLEGGFVVPLAVEYPFWNESRPEALSLFGEPIPLGKDPDRSVEEWNQHLSTSLEQTMDRLATLASRRSAEGFDTLVLGRTGVGGVYDAWRRFKALASGRRFDPSHQGGRAKQGSGG